MFTISKKTIVIFALVVGLAWGITAVYAGSALDYGQITGTPAQANYVAWWDNSNPPSQILTEDGFNSATGPDQGYQGGIWRLNASNFSPAPTQGATMRIIFGGLESDAGTIWTYSYSHNAKEVITDHGEVGSSAVGACPIMLAGSWDGVSNKVINWSGPPGTYLIYKTVLPSGGANQNGNGRYNYLATVITSGDQGTFTDTNATVPGWHIVVPANADEAIIGCHSEESNPTAVNLQNFHASAGQPAFWLPLAISLLALIFSVTWARVPLQNWVKQR